MTVPQTSYVIDNHGQKMFVQMSVKEWEAFLNNFKKLESMNTFKNKLKNAFREVKEIQNGVKKGTTLSQFLNYN